jgi:hypothetical protein
MSANISLVRSAVEVAFELLVNAHRELPPLEAVGLAERLDRLADEIRDAAAGSPCSGKRVR